MHTNSLHHKLFHFHLSLWIWKTGFPLPPSRTSPKAGLSSYAMPCPSFTPKIIILLFWCSFWPFCPKCFPHKATPFGKPWKVWKNREKLEKFKYLKKEKSFSDEIKSMVYGFEGVLFGKNIGNSRRKL